MTLWTAACQAPLSMGILQAETLEWVAMPSSRDLPKPGIEPRSPALQADSLPSEPPGKPKNTEWVAYPFSRGSPDTGIKLGSPALQVDSLLVLLKAEIIL